MARRVPDPPPRAPRALLDAQGVGPLGRGATDGGRGPRPEPGGRATDGSGGDPEPTGSPGATDHVPAAPPRGPLARPVAGPATIRGTAPDAR
jgi:hypothetical protein